MGRRTTDCGRNDAVAGGRLTGNGAGVLRIWGVMLRAVFSGNRQSAGGAGSRPIRETGTTLTVFRDFFLGADLVLAFAVTVAGGGDLGVFFTRLLTVVVDFAGFLTVLIGLTRDLVDVFGSCTESDSTTS